MTIPDGVFEDASVDNAVFCLTKTSNASLRALHDLLFIEGMTSGFSLREKQRFNVQQSFFENNEGLIFRPALTNEFAGLEASFLKSSSFLGDIARVNFGMQLRHRKKYPGDVISGEPARSAKDYRPCLTGKSIQKFNTLYGNLFCFFNKEAQMGGCWDEEIQFAKEKVIVRQVGAYPIASVDYKGYCCLNTVFMIKSILKDLCNYYLCGILNSRAISFFWKNKYSDFKDTFPKIKGSYLQKLPIPKADTAQQKQVKTLVEKLIGINLQISGELTDTKKQVLINARDSTELELNETVYDLYKFSKNEKIIIENFFQKNTGNTSLITDCGTEHLEELF